MRSPTPLNELYAVALNVPAADGVFTYRITAGLGPAEPGRRVVVPLGRRTETGIVLGPGEAQGEVRDAIRLLDDAPLLSEEIVALARWAAAHYLAPLGPALKAALPPGMDVRDALVPRLTESGRALLEAGARDNRLQLGRPHLRLPAAGGDHFGFSQGFRPGTLFQGIDDDPEIRIRQDARDRGEGGRTEWIAQTAGNQLIAS